MVARMKCRKCGRPAAINMRRHKLALCGECYPDWFRGQVERTLRRFQMIERDDRILVAVSGGKDSLALWDILLALGYPAEGLYIHLGISDGGYSEKSGAHVAAFAEARGAVCHTVNLAETYGASIPELARLRRRGKKPCSLCGLVKRHIMNRFACEGGHSVIATGHNLDDEAAVLMQNTLRWEPGYLARQAPVLPATHPRFVRKIKPLCLMYERETAAYALVRGIDYIYDECPFSFDARMLTLKQTLNHVENRSPGAKADFYKRFLVAKDRGDAVFTEPNAALLQDCDECGQPTTAPGRCAFCRLWASAEDDPGTNKEGQ